MKRPGKVVGKIRPRKSHSKNRWRIEVERGHSQFSKRDKHKECQVQVKSKFGLSAFADFAIKVVDIFKKRGPVIDTGIVLIRFEEKERKRGVEGAGERPKASDAVMDNW